MRNQIIGFHFFLMCFVLMLIPSISHAKDNKIFPISTEFQIGKIKHMIEQAPPGVLISVGSERSFRSASMMPQVTHVYLLDISPEIIRFNRINIALLKAPTRQVYCRLRWEASYEEWKNLDSLLTSEDFKWWQAYVRDLEKMIYPLPEALNKLKGLPYAQKFIKMREKLLAFYQAWKRKDTPTYPEKQFIETINYNQLKDLAKQMSISLALLKKNGIGGQLMAETKN